MLASAVWVNISIRKTHLPVLVLRAIDNGKCEGEMKEKRTHTSVRREPNKVKQNKISRIVFSVRTHSDLDFHSCCTVCRIILCSAVGTLCNIFYFKWRENLNIKKLKVARYLILPLNCLLEPSPLPNEVKSAGEREKLALAESSKENFSLILWKSLSSLVRFFRLAVQSARQRSEFRREFVSEQLKKFKFVSVTVRNMNELTIN